MYLLVTLLITFAIAEFTARLITETAPNGLLKFRIVSLVPLRPSEMQVRRALDVFSHDPFLMRDPDLGWNIRPNRNDGDQTNAQGIRTSRSHLYSADPLEGKVRIVTVGDSYVYCSQVNNGETWQDYLEQMRGDVEFLNLGLPGAGTDQAYLRWKRDGRRFNAQIVILGIWPDNINRNLNIVEYYRTQITLPLTKPRLVLDDGGPTRFVNYPVMSDEKLIATLTNPEESPLLHYEFWYNRDETIRTSYRRVRLIQFIESIWRRYQRKQIYRKIFTGEIPEGIDVTVAIAKIFAKEVRAAGSIPLVLMIPDRGHLDMAVGEKPFLLVQKLRDAGIDVIDMGPTFGAEVMKKGAAKYYVDGVGHNSPFGNKVFAHYLEKDLSPWIAKAKMLSKPTRLNEN